jgi:hypothetical protein
MRRLKSRQTRNNKGKKGCLCPNGTYSRKCCSGRLLNQGIGRITNYTNEFFLTDNQGNYLTTNNERLYVIIRNG